MKTDRAPQLKAIVGLLVERQMRDIRSLLILPLLVLSCSGNRNQRLLDDGSEVQRLQSRFAEMKAAGLSPDSTMLWGYFFFDPDQEKLRRLGKHLESQGYRIVEIHKPEDGDEFVLHVERVERHTAETLARRNGEFKSLAEQFNIQLYDGWDAGNIK